MSVDYAIELGDVAQVRSDLLVLKYAQEFYGADAAIASALADRGICTKLEMRPKPDEVVVIETRGVITPTRVMFIGVPPLRQFRYTEMRQMAQGAIRWITDKNVPINSLTTTVHGAGYGLDVEESLQAMVFGFQLALNEHSTTVTSIRFVENNPRRAGTLETSLRSMGVLSVPRRSQPKESAAVIPTPSEKKTVFVAMPFSGGFEDVFEFGIYGPVRRCGYVCEKVDESAFAGDIVARIQEGIREARFVIADLSEEKPNVYLEVGFAWGLNKPVILIAREGQRLHFDLSHHKCLFYSTIGRLSSDLERLIRQMFALGSSADRVGKS